MTEIRFVNNEELKHAAALSDSIFRDSEQTSMGVAFPQIFSSGLNQSMAAFEAGKLVAFMGLVPNIINIGRSQLQVHSLGSVCTDSEYRGKGHASLLLEQIYTFIKDSGSSLLLVSGDRTLYTRSGCRKFGEIKHYSITVQDAETIRQSNEGSSVNLRLFEAKDAFALHKLRKNNSVAFEESLFGTTQLIESEAVASIAKLKHKLYVAELAGKIIASLIVAVQDKHASKAEPFIVEWNGVASVAVNLIAYAIQQDSLAKINLYSPWHELDMHETLEGVSHTTIHNSGTIKIVDSKKLWEQLQPHLNEKSPDASAVVELLEADEADTVQLSVLGNVIRLSYDEVVDLLFNPLANVPLLKPYKSVLDHLFPIAFPYTAGLHYV
ncbi:GNAT family N-acetyltransferase [Paenibacillus psychroresistens]|uniref:GNAT family N-acetyltransferase n=1 Tax=Paenibacillus psychroresistens TaxID=1778678 RepID=UPI0013913972|nr:GNAT family N-acetyltransferase [Paenibacillus psychroresistens]